MMSPLITVAACRAATTMPAPFFTPLLKCSPTFATMLRFTPCYALRQHYRYRLLAMRHWRAADYALPLYACHILSRDHVMLDATP